MLPITPHPFPTAPFDPSFTIGKGKELVVHGVLVPLRQYATPQHIAERVQPFSPVEKKGGKSSIIDISIIISHHQSSSVITRTARHGALLLPGSASRQGSTARLG